MGSLQDALRQAGLADSKKKKKPQQPQRGAIASNNKPSSESIDLAKAYRLRQAEEKRALEQKKKDKIAAQEARRRRNLELEKILKDQSLNEEGAQCARFFEYKGKVRRVWCTESQRDAIGKELLAIVLFRGSPLLVAPDVAQKVATIAPDLVVDLSQTGQSQETDSGDDYPPVPDDLMW